MNKVDKHKGCAIAENTNCGKSIPNGAQCEPPECEKLAEDIDKLRLKAKTLNGIVNGTNEDIGIVHGQKTETSQEHETQIAHADQISHEEAKPGKKSKSKRKGKCESIEPKCDSNPCLQEDFDITSIIRNKYKQTDCGEDKIKIVVSQLERLELKDDKTCVPDGNDPPRVENPNIEYVAYQSELQMPLIMKIIQKDLSEPYSIYTYRYFIHNWPNLCFLAMHEGKCVGAIVCKLDMHRKVIKRGYIAMLAVDKQYRKHGLGSTLVKRAIQEMIAGEADEVVLETEITNRPALRLYEALGFVRDKRLFRYYLNGVDALRLKLWLR